ncbi:MAG: Holliday junction resolvase RecU [Erysipelotrichaceae bacterium]
MIKYPNGKPITANKQAVTTRKARGMSLEQDLNESNAYYVSRNFALIHKKPTPIQVVRVDYPSRAHAKIVEAYYKVPSTTDYNGIYRGRAIDFEAKETKNKVSFTFQGIHPHQISHLKAVLSHGGIGFVILRFTSYDETYLVDASDVIQQYEDVEKKSLPYTWVKQHAHLIRNGLYPKLHYLEVVDRVYFMEEKQ